MIGIDLVNIKRFKELIENEKFINRIYTEYEIENIKNKKDEKRKVEIMAGTFAAKEAFSKALGTGIGKLSWKDIEIKRNENGKPEIKLNNKLKDKYKVKLSISHETEFAIAVCTLEKNNNFEINKNILISKRKKESNKGDYGKIGIIGGSIGMIGAPMLSSFSALRTGSGLVYTIVPKSISEIISMKSLENIVIPLEDKDKGYFRKESIKELLDKIEKIEVLAIGPGIRNNTETSEFLKYVLEIGKPTIIDADALNIISENKDLLRINKNIILTPHLMEFSRLTKISIKDIQKNREKVASDFVKEYELNLVLKGNKTLVINREEKYINNSGNPGMATAGSGDVLTGIITSLVGQKHRLFEAAKIGVYLHGLSGDIAAKEKGEYGIIASDIVEKIPYALNLITGG